MAELGAERKSGLTRTLAATLATIGVIGAFTLAIVFYDVRNVANVYVVLGTPILIGLLAFRSWTARMLSIIPLILLGFVTMTLVGGLLT
jgi:hypothetical protein